MSSVTIGLALVASFAFLFCAAGWFRFYNKPDENRRRELALVMTFGCGSLAALLVAFAFQL